MTFDSYYGVDFSGARLAGRNTWIARLDPVSGKRRSAPYRLSRLSRLEDLCGTAEREAALSHLVRLIAGSERALWALDFPFGLPVEIMGAGEAWSAQFEFLREWGDDAWGVGHECIRRAAVHGSRKHIRRLTDAEERAPFDPYHFRIIYQTFHGMRDVLLPVKRLRKRSVILPFEYRRLAGARRVLVEACPASTLKRLGLPHQNYKQIETGRITPKRLRTRRVIVEALGRHVEIDERDRRRIMRNPGGDALDAVLAGVGAARAWAEADHRRIARHPRYKREGRLYV